MNYNLFMIKLQIAEITRQQEQKRLQYIDSIKHRSK